jgi:hypothetical protein
MIAGSLNRAPAYVSFSNVTDADFGASAASEDGVTDREVIFPLRRMSVTGIVTTKSEHCSLPETEEVSDLLLAGLGGYPLDVHCSRHDGRCNAQIAYFGKIILC